jgi:adenosylcobinamide kinase/adenosylcobinamide-phosphate guanylyltransferase
MRILVEGSGGTAGWPQPGCRCASCLRQAAVGISRIPSTIVVDGQLRLGTGYEGSNPEMERHETGNPVRSNALEPGVHAVAGGAGPGTPGDAGAPGDAGRPGAVGYRVRRVPDLRGGGGGGWDVTAPDGGRLLYPAGPGSVPAPPEGSAPYDVAFLDLLGDPAQLGWLRARGLITAGTVTAVAYADHRVPSEAELARRCGFWRVRLAGDGEAIDPARSVPNDRDLAAGTRRVVVLGGARSGKSERAELRLAGEPDVTYVATGNRGADDPDWAARVAAHRARRPAWWRTAETTDLAGLLGRARGALLIDGIGSWLAAVFDECGWDLRDDAARDKLAARVAELTSAWRQTRCRVVAVSDETGLGVVPATPAGRLFRDELGRLNQALAAESEEAELVVAGRILPLGE